MSYTSQIKNLIDKGLDCKDKKRDRSASEERLVLAAIETFSKHGYDGSTTKMIAAKADVNESLIGRYFDGKEGLLLAIIERFLGEVCDEEIPTPPQDTLADELCKYMDFKIGKAKERDHFAKIIITQALTDNKFRKKALERIPMFNDPQLMSRLGRLQEIKQIPADANLNDICSDLENYLHGVFLFELILRETPEAEAIKEGHRFVRHYARGFQSSGT